jgi:hypothetical protein
VFRRSRLIRQALQPLGVRLLSFGSGARLDFDQLAKDVARGLSRRELLRRLARTALGAAVISFSREQAEAATSTCTCNGTTIASWESCCRTGRLEQRYNPILSCCTPSGVRRKNPIEQIPGLSLSDVCPNRVKTKNPAYRNVSNGCGTPEHPLPEGDTFTLKGPFDVVITQFRVNWRGCCDAHDYAWGTCCESAFMDCQRTRELADTGFGDCIQKKCLDGIPWWLPTLRAKCIALYAIGGYKLVSSDLLTPNWEAAQREACDCCPGDDPCVPCPAGTTQCGDGSCCNGFCCPFDGKCYPAGTTICGSQCAPPGKCCPGNWPGPVCAPYEDCLTTTDAFGNTTLGYCVEKCDTFTSGDNRHWPYGRALEAATSSTGALVCIKPLPPPTWVCDSGVLTGKRVECKRSERCFDIGPNNSGVCVPCGRPLCGDVCCPDSLFCIDGTCGECRDRNAYCSNSNDPDTATCCTADQRCEYAKLASGQYGYTGRCIPLCPPPSRSCGIGPEGTINGQCCEPDSTCCFSPLYRSGRCCPPGGQCTADGQCECIDPTTGEPQPLCGGRCCPTDQCCIDHRTCGPCPQISCPSGQVSCGGHCCAGSCCGGVACCPTGQECCAGSVCCGPDQHCINGHCAGCPPGYVACGEECCRSDEACINGHCTPADCPGGGIRCNGVCCSPGRGCVEGRCSPYSPSCSVSGCKETFDFQGRTCCDESCCQTAPIHNGGHPDTPPTEVCVNGQCLCAPGHIYCPSVFSVAPDGTPHYRHCCSVDTDRCVSVGPAFAPEQRCVPKEWCVNDSGCPAGMHCDGVRCCDPKRCVPVGDPNCRCPVDAECPPGQPVCNGQCCAGNCCGGVVCCPIDQACCDGGVCCGPGQKCVSGVCVKTCPEGQTLCNGACCPADQRCLPFPSGGAPLGPPVCCSRPCSNSVEQGSFCCDFTVDGVQQICCPGLGCIREDQSCGSGGTCPPGQVSCNGVCCALGQSCLPPATGGASTTERVCCDQACTNSVELTPFCCDPGYGCCPGFGCYDPARVFCCPIAPGGPTTCDNGLRCTTDGCV